MANPQALVPGAPASSTATGEARARYVRSMFARIVPGYDLLNRVLSLGLDQRWRRRALERLGIAPGMRLLDACCGTGDLGLAALELAPGIRVVGSDFCPPMVAEARRKALAAGGEGPKARWLAGDTLRLPFPDRTFDRAVVGFGVRNLGDLDLGLREFQRVLVPGGRLAVLEFSTPWLPVFKQACRFYLRHVLPRIGALGSKDGEAYSYLSETILRFPDQAGLARRLEAAGFVDVEWQDLLFGVVAIHTARRPP